MHHLYKLSHKSIYTLRIAKPTLINYNKDNKNGTAKSNVKLPSTGITNRMVKGHGTLPAG